MTDGHLNNNQNIVCKVIWATFHISSQNPHRK